jgi:hypothetical protein
MRKVQKAAHSTGSSSSRTWPWILILPIILCLLPAVAGGAIDVSESHLHGGQKVYAQRVYGVEDPPYLNDQDITLWAWGETDPLSYSDVTFTAYGLFSRYDTVDVVNDGTVNVNAVGGNVTSTSSADAGLSGYGVFTSGDASSSGNITVTLTGGTAEASDGIADAGVRGYGLWTWDAGSNSGNINVTIAGGTAKASDGRAHVSIRGYGLWTSREVSNSGNINVTITGGTAEADDDADASIFGYGLRVSDEIGNSGNINVAIVGGTAEANDGVADASIFGQGLWALREVSNRGNIAVTVAGGTAEADDGRADASIFGAGLRTYDEVSNSGNIDMTITGGTAAANEGAADASVSGYGVETYRTVSNSGTINVTVIGGTAEADDDADASALGCGLHLDKQEKIQFLSSSSGTLLSTEDIIVTASDRQLTNTGDIAVTVTGGTAAGGDARADVDAYGIYAREADVVNLGDITVTAQAVEGSTSRTYGIYHDYGGSLTNTGVIRLSGDTCYEVYVGGNTTLLDVYNVTLDGDPGNAAFYVADHAELALNDATLTVTAVSGETLWNTEYQLFETDGSGVVDGSFADVQAANPKTSVTYHTQETSSAADDTVSLSYTPRASEATGSAAVAQQMVSRSIDTVNQHMTATVLQNILSLGTSGLLADAGPTGRSMVLAQSDSGTESGIFVEPYYSTMEHDANPLGYDARLWGFAAGYERQMDDTLIGLHLGYGQADVDYTGAGYSANSEDQDILTGGLSGLTRWNDWTLRYGLTGFYGSHDYRGLTGVSLAETEKSSTDSYGVMASVMAGHIFQRGSHIFLPEVGVNYLWGHRQRYTTKASDPAWDTTYSAINDHDLQAEAALHWLCGFMHGDVHVSPSASIGVRHLLTDGESTVSQSVPGTAPVLVTSERDRTAMTLSGSVALTKARHTVSVSYDGEYASDTERHSFWLRYGWQF